MIPDGAPAVFFVFFDNANLQWIDVDVGQTVDQSLPLVDNDAFEAVSPEIATPVIPAVVPAGEVDFDVPYERRKTCQLGSLMRHVTFGHDKIFAAENRMSVADMITQYFLTLKRGVEGEYMKTIIDRTDFRRAMENAQNTLRDGTARWHPYDEVFED